MQHGAIGRRMLSTEATPQHAHTEPASDLAPAPVSDLETQAASAEEIAESVKSSNSGPKTAFERKNSVVSGIPTPPSPTSTVPSSASKLQSDEVFWLQVYQTLPV